jgi:predicted dehydrogenase
MNNVVHWGILGAGKIASKFADAFKQVKNARLIAVASSSIDRARAFAEQHQIKTAFGSYHELVTSKNIDVIYVATRNHLHCETTMLCINHGKNVLCEKPFAISASEALSMIKAARDRDLFLMEAMWTRFFPVIQYSKQLVDQGVIGNLLRIHADFGFSGDSSPTGRLQDPNQGGGSLLDVGVYPVSLTSMFWGTPEKITSNAIINSTGVDNDCAIILAYPQSRLAVLSSSIRVNTPKEAFLCGENGMIKIECPWWKPSELKIFKNNQLVQHITMPYEGNGLQFEIEEVNSCIRNGKKESPKMPLDETLEIMKTLDKIKASWSK